MNATEEVRLARAYLVGVAEPPAPALVAFVEQHGPVEAAARVRRGNVPEVVAT
ncbi:MAG: DNA processing protein DprA, partial [Pseudonocardia sp.]|nr:DNA processing protein DprA [Pseudonocardia sp.]